MARFVDAIDLPLPVEQAFDLLADFSRTREWDPGVVEAERLSTGPVGLGSRFRVVTSLLGYRTELEYEITAYERPQRLVLEASTGAVTSRDEITFVARGDGVRVSYEARLEPAGPLRLADPALNLLFQLVGRTAADGLRQHGARLAHERTRRPHARRATGGARR